MSYNESLTRKIDILDRKEFIDRAVQIINLVSSNKGNLTFAINGSWGSGKTFVLDRIEETLADDPLENFVVIHYNCWKYDYYDEPLIALVSVLNDFEDSTKHLPDDAKAAFRVIAKEVGKSIFTQFIKQKTGIDLSSTLQKIDETGNLITEATNNNHDYDPFFSFTKELSAVKDGLEKISEKHTIVLAVDELDRCLPEYSIKVLERLHHIAEGIPNFITIISVDKSRLVNTVESIFGKKSAENYLKKFIRFEMKLDLGKQGNPKFFEKFSDFYNRFDSSLYGELNDTDQFLEELFRDIDIRTQEHLVEKATIFHDICFGDEKQDHSVMYMELFYSTLYYYYKNKEIFSNKKKTYTACVFQNNKEMPSAFAESQSGFNFSKRIASGLFGNIIVLDSTSTFSMIYYYWYSIPLTVNSERTDKELYPKLQENHPRFTSNTAKLKKYLDVMESIS